MFNFTSVRTKLVVAFGTLVLLLIVLAAVALRALSAADDRFTHYVHGINARQVLASQVRASVDKRAIAARNLVLVTDPGERAAEFKSVTEAHVAVQTFLKQFNDAVGRATDMSSEAHQLATEIGRIEATYGPIALAIVELARQDKHAEAIEKSE